MNVRSILLLAALAAGCRAAPPELQVAAGNWFNAAKPPRLADLRGRVVWLEFGFST
ncbi:MAG: hypothetical protein ACREIU_05430 [Planctomycetota bacterium]